MLYTNPVHDNMLSLYCPRANQKRCYIFAACRHRTKEPSRVKMAACGWGGCGARLRISVAKKDLYETTKQWLHRKQYFPHSIYIFVLFGSKRWRLYTSWFTRCPGPRNSSMTGICCGRGKEAFNQYSCTGCGTRAFCVIADTLEVFGSVQNLVLYICFVALNLA